MGKRMNFSERTSQNFICVPNGLCPGFVRIKKLGYRKRRSKITWEESTNPDWRAYNTVFPVKWTAIYRSDEE